MKFDKEKNEHIITIRFKLPLVDDKIDYNDPNNKKKGYKVIKGDTDLQGIVTPVKRGKFSAPLTPYSTVTDFAKLRG